MEDQFFIYHFLNYNSFYFRICLSDGSDSLLHLETWLHENVDYRLTERSEVGDREGKLGDEWGTKEKDKDFENEGEH